MRSHPRAQVRLGSISQDRDQYFDQTCTRQTHPGHEQAIAHADRTGVVVGLVVDEVSSQYRRTGFHA